jgi:uncharacterized protein YcbK (DUF882 family)
MTINSGYRCPNHNAEVGGEENSLHMKGVATDIMLPTEFNGMSDSRKRQFLINIRTKWFEICNKYGAAGGSGFYKTFFHLDSRQLKRAKWDESPYFNRG